MTISSLKSSRFAPASFRAFSTAFFTATDDAVAPVMLSTFRLCFSTISFGISTTGIFRPTSFMFPSMSFSSPPIPGVSECSTTSILSILLSFRVTSTLISSFIPLKAPSYVPSFASLEESFPSSELCFSPSFSEVLLSSSVGLVSSTCSLVFSSLGASSLEQALNPKAKKAAIKI